MLVIRWGKVVQLRMAALAVVEDFNILKDAGLSFVSSFVPVMVDPFGLQGIEEALYDRVVVTIAFSAHAADHVV